MPIHLIWGDDYEACNREIEEIIQTVLDPSWKSFNYSQIDGNDQKQNFRALEEVQSAPLGNGGRVVLVRRSPFCNGCSIELANKLEQAIKLIPNNTYLILNNSNKPDKRLKTTKLIEKSIQSNSFSKEKSFLLPLPWDINGQRNLVKNILYKLNLKMNHEAIDLKGEIFIALNKIQSLLKNGEPALRLIITLTGQSRGWLWVHLLDSQGTQDVKEIAKLAGIANPKRIFIIRKQIQGKSLETLLELMKKLLKIEASIKSGANPIDSFKDNLLTDSQILTNN